MYVICLVNIILNYFNFLDFNNSYILYLTYSSIVCLKEGSLMEKITNFFIWLFIISYFFIIIFGELIGESIHNPFDYARITDVDYHGVLVDEPNGNYKMVVTERLTFDVHAADSEYLFWELWRDLPENEIDGVKSLYNVLSVKQILPNGNEIIYDESDKLYWEDEDYTATYLGYGPRKWYHSPGPYNEWARRYEAVFFYVDGLYREEIVFEIKYEMTNPAQIYADSSELYLTLYSEETIRYLESYSAEILIADKDMPREGNYKAHTYGTKNIDFEFTESDTEYPGFHTFSFDLDKDDLKFTLEDQYLEFSLVSFGDDKHIFTDYAPANYYSTDNVLDELLEEQNYYDSMKKVYSELPNKIFNYCFILSLLVELATLFKLWRIRKKYTFYKPRVKYHKGMESGNVPSGLDPCFAANLVFCKDNPLKDTSNAYSAVMLSLIRKGYVELERINPLNDWNFDNIKILVNFKPLNTVIDNPLYTPPTTINNTNTGINNMVRNTYRRESILGQVFYTSFPGDNPNLKPYSIYSNQIQNNNSLNTYSERLSNKDQITDQELDKQIVTANLNKYQPIFQTPNADKKELEPLTLTEEIFFNLIIRHTDGIEVTMKDFQKKVSKDAANTSAFVTNMENAIAKIGVTHGYFQKLDYTAPKKEIRRFAKFLLWVGIFSLTVVNFISSFTYYRLAKGGYILFGLACIVCSIILYKKSNKYILLTEFGEEQYVSWKSLYNYLNNNNLATDKTPIEAKTGEKYLVYATAFGISEKVSNALGIRCKNIPINESKLLHNTYYRSSSYRTNFSSFDRTTRSTSRSYTSSIRSSYGGSSGGFGGYSGGRGGGGGGGGH